MNSITAKTGFTWIVNGYGIFRQRPFLMTNLFFGYMIGLTVLGIIPFIGQILPIVVMPVFSFLFMQTCYKIDSGTYVSFRDLFNIFTRQTMNRLLLLGSLYLLYTLLLAVIAIFVDGGLLIGTVSQQAAEELTSSQQVKLFMTLVLVSALYIPFAMAVWFATPLIGWQKMSIGKAIFFSFFAVLRTLKAFLVYIFCWLVLGMFMPVIIGSVLILLGFQNVAMFIMVVLSVFLSILAYCSFYPTYKDVFGQPDTDN